MPYITYIIDILTIDRQSGFESFTGIKVPTNISYYGISVIFKIGGKYYVKDKMVKKIVKEG